MPLHGAHGSPRSQRSDSTFFHADVFLHHASGQTPSGAVHVYEEPLRSSIHGVLVLRLINIRLTAVFMALNLDGFVLSLDTTQEDVSRLKKLFLP